MGGGSFKDMPNLQSIVRCEDLRFQLDLRRNELGPEAYAIISKEMAGRRNPLRVMMDANPLLPNREATFSMGVITFDGAIQALCDFGCGPRFADDVSVDATILVHGTGSEMITKVWYNGSKIEPKMTWRQADGAADCPDDGHRDG